MALSPRVSLVLIAALFVGPLLVAWLMYAGIIQFEPENTRNLGELVSPPVPLDWQQLDTIDGNREELLNHWVVVKPVVQSCDDSCRQELLDIRQVHKASGRYQSRILLAVVYSDRPAAADLQWLQQAYPKFLPLLDPQSEAGEVFSKAGPGMSYLVDPLGNIMMRYETGSDPNDLKKDLKRLLKWSKLDDKQ